MKIKIHILTLFMLAMSAIATAQDITTDIQDSSVFKIHLSDVAENYGLQKAFFEDTNALENYMAAQPQDFAALIQLCQTTAINARTMIADLDLDYRDGVVWLDTNLCIIDYEKDRLGLQCLAAKADELQEHYTKLEDERIAKERRLAEQRAKEEARRRQIAQDNRLAALHEEINTHHRTINHLCNGAVEDKTRQKTLKDLYYAYLAVYNKFDVTTPTATDRLLSENDMLNMFQQNLIDSVLSENSYLNRIDHFKDQLKEATSEGYSNVYKSYSRLFKRVAIAINFSTIDEYSTYINELHEVINTQQLYMQSIQEQREIDALSKKILSVYGKKYRDIANAYRSTESAMDFTPTFLNSASGLQYIDFVNEFKEVQQRYINNFDRLEQIHDKGDSIIASCNKKFIDVASAYKELVANTSFIATFSTLDGANQYDQKLENFETVQQYYVESIELREVIAIKDDSIRNAKSIDKVLATGYKNIRKTCVLTPHFTTAEQGAAFVKVLNEHIDLQNEFLLAFAEHAQLDQNINSIDVAAKPYKNIDKAYGRLAKTMNTNREIISKHDLDVYIKVQRQHLQVQDLFLEILRSANAVEVNQQLTRVSDVEKIKLILKIQ